MPSNIDPLDEQLHRVPLPELEKYKVGVVPKVTAICGKRWAPTFPVKRMNSRPRCPVCFPIEKYRFAVAA